MNAIHLNGLTKAFGAQVALDGLDLEVEEGMVLALIGPNGSGKTTTVRILSTLLQPDAGAAYVAGHDVVHEPASVREVIGVTGQFSAVDNLLTPRENLVLTADLYRVGRRGIDALLERFELTEAMNKPAATLSGGMRRRLDLALTLVGKPKIIFLDEPTTGLDPRSRRVLWEIVRELGVTILLTTQYLDEADALADEVAVIDHGALVAQGSPQQLKRRVPGGSITLSFREEDLAEAARLLPAAREGLTFKLSTDGSARAVREILDSLASHNVEARHIEVQPPTLDDVFFALTGGVK